MGHKFAGFWGQKNSDYLTNNPTKIYGLEGFGVSIAERVPIEMEVQPEDAFYLQTKQQKMGHLFSHMI